MPRTKQRTPVLRERVLSSAVDLLAREGVAGFTTRSVARESATSTPAVYELFGDKAGLVREVFFEGFRLLRRKLNTVSTSKDPRADLIELIRVYRQFATENSELAQVMFSRPFTDFDPSNSEIEASASVRTFILEHVRRCIDSHVLDGDETDIAHVLIALTQGMAAAESSGRLGSTQESIDRRWELAIEVILEGLNA